MFDSVHPNLLAIISAILIATARTLYRNALSYLSPTFTTIIATLVTLQFAWIFYLYEGGVEKWPIQGILWFALIGIVGGLGGRYLGMVSIKSWWDWQEARFSARRASSGRQPWP